MALSTLLYAMLGLLVRHGFVAIVIEELGVPMPIPTDVLIVFAGTSAGMLVPQLGLFFVILTLASSIGASGLYMGSCDAEDARWSSVSVATCASDRSS